MRVAWVMCAIVVSSATLDMASAREPDTFASALMALEGWLAHQPQADQWREYLKVDALRAEASRNGRPNRAVIASVLTRLGSESESLDKLRGQPPIVALRRSLERWLVRESLPAGRELSVVVSSILKHSCSHESNGVTVGGPMPRCHALRLQLVALVSLLGNYANEPTDELATSIAAHLDALATSPDAAPMVDAVREFYSHPNVWIDISEDLLDDSVNGEIDRWNKIETVVLGTRMSGKGRVRAVRKLVIESRAEEAVLKIVVAGTIDSNTVGYSGPARIDSHALTQFSAEKSIILTGSGLRVLPAVCDAETHTLNSRVTTNQGGLRGRIVRRVGQRRSEELRAAADRESSLHARQRLIKSVDERADALVKRLDRLAVLPILALGGLSDKSQVSVCSERRVLRLGTIIGPLGAPPGRPRCDAHSLVTVRLHETLVSRLSHGPFGEAVSAELLDSLNPALALLASVKTADSTAAQGAPPVAQLLGSATTARRRFLVPSIFDTWRPGNVAWNWLQGAAAPRLTTRGITLRDGRWGTILPAGMGTEWLAAEWRPAAPERRMANVRVGEKK